MELLISQLSIIKNLIESKQFYKAHEESLNLNKYDTKLEHILTNIMGFNFGEALLHIDEFIYRNKSLLDYYSQTLPDNFIFMPIKKFKDQCGFSKITVLKSSKTNTLFCTTNDSTIFSVQHDIDPEFEMAFLIYDSNISDAKLVNLNIDLKENYIQNSNYKNDEHLDDFERETFEDYNGSHAQDFEGLSDQFIDDVFDGDPSMYWNID
ncbi:hypothetical protein [Algibacter mikhailovii]|uniref:Uncharacterized protein n=1 Tax=Algibacter mikhailovii TaxID=425498 RepID=A0A918QVG5_9FLAO|nr:hypothetical protein [Algibacter mikhailovii]GGZ72459.1 hypothetical protein GCM10007028_06850 [Algibacter mikhailovii]